MRLYILLLTALLVACSSASLAATPDGSGPEASDAPSKMNVSSPAESMRIGQEALNAGDYQRAYDIFTALLREHPGDLNVNFNLGLAAYGAGKFPHAASAFERILARQPEADRVRLELAMTYVAMGQFDQAKEEFEIVLSHNPPETVQTNVRTVMANMEESRKRWRIKPFVSVGALYDSNANAGLNKGQVELGGFPVIPADSEKAQEDWGRFIAAGVGVDYFLDEKKIWTIGADLQGFQKWYERHEANDLEYYMAGLRLNRQFRNGSMAQLAGKYETIEFGYDDLVDILGISPTYFYPLTQRIHLITQAGYENRDYVDKLRESDYFSFGEDIRFLFGLSNHELLVGGNVFTEQADSTAYSNNGWELRVRPLFRLPWESELYFRASVRETNYHEVAAELVGEKREDSLSKVSAGLRKYFWLRGMSADLSYEYTNNNSNTDIYDYERNTVTFSITYAP